MKRKNKKKFLRFFSVFLIISTIFVVFAFPISALDIGGGATLTGLYSELWRGGDGNSPGEIHFESSDVSESNEQISFLFNLSALSDDSIERLVMTNYSYYSFSSSNNYGSLTFSIRSLGGFPAAPVLENYGIYDSSTNLKISTSSNFFINDNGTITINFIGNIPSRFYIYTIWWMNPTDYPLTSFVSYNLSFTPRNEVADKLNEDKYPSFSESQDEINDSQQIEDDSLNNANGFIDNTVDFVFDRSLWTEGNFINGLRVASTTFENFASIPFIGTILKYAVIFGLIAFVLGLATFVMRRRK